MVLIRSKICYSSGKVVSSNHRGFDGGSNPDPPKHPKIELFFKVNKLNSKTFFFFFLKKGKCWVENYHGDYNDKDSKQSRRFP